MAWPKGEPVALRGARVALDPLSLDHERALQAVVREDDLWKSPYTVVPHPWEVRNYIESALRARDRGAVLPFAVRVIASGRIVGTGRFQFMVPYHRKLQIGSAWIAKSWQGKYVALEGALTGLAYAFEVLRAVRVEFVLDPENKASRRLVKRLGAKEEGLLRNHLTLPNGRVHDSIIFSIVDHEWPEVRSSIQHRLATLFPEPSANLLTA
jgi:RimJ/RimL family protein N-acetyltransferase